MMADSSGTTTYRFDQAVVLRVVGPGLVLIGMVWALGAVLGVGTTAGLALGAVTLVFVAVAVIAVLRPPRLLTLSDQGFRVSRVRGAGTPVADWADVNSVETRSERPGSQTVVVSLNGGSLTLIPVSLLGRRNLEARREIHDRLNAAHGYRHLDAS